MSVCTLWSTVIYSYLPLTLHPTVTLYSVCRTWNYYYPNSYKIISKSAETENHETCSLWRKLRHRLPADQHRTDLGTTAQRPDHCFPYMVKLLPYRKSGRRDMMLQMSGYGKLFMVETFSWEIFCKQLAFGHGHFLYSMCCVYFSFHCVWKI